MAVNLRSLFSISRPHNRYRDNERLSLDDCGIEMLQMQLESDRGRIIQSAAVRRLQQKTQVYPLEKNSAVRSRLTHSMEVMQTGRHIVQTIYRRLGTQAKSFGLEGLERPIESLVEMACLLHDVGNPPFGHFGEAAISQWFQTHLPQLPAFAQTKLNTEGNTEQQQLQQRLISDLSHFEGNAQAIRLSHSLLRLNLTYAQSACILKYTRLAAESRPPAGDAFSYLKKKPGFYLSEQSHIQELQQVLGIEQGCRYPLSYIMEAADDISYCLADIEDGVEKGLMSYQTLAQLLIENYAQHEGGADVAQFPPEQPKRSFREIVDYACERASRETINKAHEFFIWLRVGLIHHLVEHAAQGFIDHIEQVAQGRLNRALLEDDTPCHQVIATFKNIAFEHFFSHPEVETLDLQGHHILTALLNHYRPLLMLDTAAFTQLSQGQYRGFLVESLLFKRLPNKHIRAYQEAMAAIPVDQAHYSLWEQYYRCRLLQDMVSGMTDQYALDEYRTLSALD
jgi:dGTPase